MIVHLFVLDKEFNNKVFSKNTIKQHAKVLKGKIDW